MKYVLEFDHVWKKFKKGEKLNSLRDAIPHLFKQDDKNIPLQDLEFWAVKDVSFNIEKGDVVGIMGANGAGKSTVLKLLSRIMIPNRGSMKINGRLSALIEVTAGFHPELTGRENVYLNATILGMRKKEIDNKFDEIVDFSGVKEFIDTPVKRYSSGMYSRLGFSVAAHMDPDILLIDEVLSVGDISFQAKCAQKIRDLLSCGATIVLVSHQLDMIQSLCKRVILLQNGEVTKDGPAELVIPHYQNIVFKKKEDDLRNKMKSMDGRVGVDTRSLVDIVHVDLKKNYGYREKINITLEYATRENEKIDHPIFNLDIVRADCVHCCSSRTDILGIKIDSIQGKGKVEIDLGENMLAPGIYMVKFSIWDKEMIHPYIIHNKEVIRVEIDGLSNHSDIVFLPEVKWKF
ncbi:MAG: ATP-binding cassette domain-containing protein [Candidatus Omnitrophica bacterium]|nr:ATP-binding cassette domain-containing protein [Candidatus Omnitrophota bacterium]